MTTVVTMPQLGETVVGGTVARWLKALGETVDKFEPLLEITTDKIDTEIPSPATGTLVKIVALEGETVSVGGTLAHIGEAGETVGQLEREPVKQGSVPVASISVAEPVEATDIEIVGKPSGRAFISPVVARIASEHKVDLETLPGTGLGGRITKKDIAAFVASASSATDTPTFRPTGPLATDETLHPLTPMRRAIAQHMVVSKQTSPHVTTVYEVDMTAVVRHREANRQPLAGKGITLTYMSYFVAAVAVALREVPEVNSRFTAEGIVLSQRIHIGVAVSLADGLIVPVVRDADEKNLQGLARAVNELSTRARSGTLAANATHGGTFTITNHGVTGSLLGTPIINQPQSGILGIGTITKRAVVRSATNSLLPSADDALVIRPMCYLSFSFDHRVLDGAKADAFLTVVKTALEHWKD